MIFIVSTFIYLLVKVHCLSEIVPVLMIDNENVLSSLNIESNPFERTSPENFENILSMASQKTATVIIFVENYFCSEDLSGKDDRGTPYYHLRHQLLEKKVKYFPAVVSAYRLILRQFVPQQYNVFHLRSTTTKLQIFDGRFKYFYAYFDDNGNETRVEALRRHDLIMKEVYFVLRQMSSGPVVAIYTGRKNSIDIAKELKETYYFVESPPKPTETMLFSTNTTLYKFSGLQLLTNGRRWLQEQPLSVDEVYDQNFIRTKLEFAGFLLEFNYKLSQKEWALDSIKLWEEDEEVGSLRTSISAPWGYSYACHEKLVLVNQRDGSVITIPQYQIEPMKEWMDDRNDLTVRSGNRRRFFRATISCGPYFSASIVMALFVVALLLCILFYGIVSIMDVRTNSRFDDPQGKQLGYTDAGGGGHNN